MSFLNRNEQPAHTPEERQKFEQAYIEKGLELRAQIEQSPDGRGDIHTIAELFRIIGETEKSFAFTRWERVKKLFGSSLDPEQKQVTYTLPSKNFRKAAKSLDNVLLNGARSTSVDDRMEIAQCGTALAQSIGQSYLEKDPVLANKLNAGIHATVMESIFPSE